MCVAIMLLKSDCNKDADQIQALVQASLQERYSDIPQSTIGVIFVGTPHRGTSVANMGDIAQRVGKAVLPGYQPNRLIIQNLKKNCDSLYQSADNFGNISKRLKIYSFYETVGSIVSITRQHKRT